MNKTISILAWGSVAALGSAAVAVVALHRGEPINALWLVTAATCCYALGYRFYSKFIATKILALDALRATPAERLENGRDFLVTNKWVVFGHHFAAIAGPGPLVGPVLAAQFGYLPGTLWVLAGAVFAGCVQDFVILLFSVRRDGKSLTEMAKEETGRVGGFVAYAAVIAILIILLAVVALVVVNALKGSPWGTFTIAMTIPIALLMGIYLRRIRPGKVLEVSVLGFVLVLLAIWGGQWAAQNPDMARVFTLRAPTLAILIIVYAFAASAMPVWLLLAPRDYLSTFVKLGTIGLLAIGIVVMHPTLHMPALTRFVDGTRPRVRRQGLSLCLHYHRLRRDQWLPRADLQRNHAKAHRARNRDPHRRLRRHDGRIRRCRYGDHRRLRSAARCLLRYQQPSRRGRSDRCRRDRNHLRLGISRDCRRHASPGSRRRGTVSFQPHWRRSRIRSRYGAHLLSESGRREGDGPCGTTSL